MAMTKQCGHDVLGIDERIRFPGLPTWKAGIAEQKRHANGFVPGTLLFRVSLGAQHVAVIGREDENGSVGKATCLKRAEKVPHAGVQR